MDLEYANELINDLYLNLGTQERSEDETNMLIEALEYKIRTLNDDNAMMYLSYVYGELSRYDLQVKYAELALMGNSDHVKASICESLGYIYYYGRTGKVDYKKAFEYFLRGSQYPYKLLSMYCKYKVADMYKNGYYVEKDYKKYKDIIKEIYEEIKNEVNLDYPIPEIFTRLARIEKEEGNIARSLDLYFYATDFLSQRIRCNNFFGYFNIMKWAKEDIYTMIEVDLNHLDFYDLYVVLKTPHQLAFKYAGERHVVESKIVNNYMTILFDHKAYRDIDYFMQHASVYSIPLYEIYNQIHDIEVIK